MRRVAVVGFVLATAFLMGCGDDLGDTDTGGYVEPEEEPSWWNGNPQQEDITVFEFDDATCYIYQPHTGNDLGNMECVEARESS